MSVYIFTGPTLTPAEAGRELTAVYLPPVSQSDVYRVALRRPRAIGIIDGYFQGVPSVWHKEILWAMSQGVHVYGAASMGALRAAELAQFGMVGIGRIFTAYQQGELEDDDEVAVRHGQAGVNYAPVSEAMVNIRFTLLEAERQGAIAAATREKLIALGKNLFHYQRGYDRLLQEGVQQRLPAEELAALRSWLPTGAINQKRLDAVAMLRALREFLAQDPAPQQTPYSFEATSAWEKIRIPVVPVETATATAWLPLDELLDELRLAGLRVSGEQETRLQALAMLDEPLFIDHLVDYLKTFGDYERLAVRALAKQRTLAGLGVLRPSLDELPLDRKALLAWHGERRPSPSPEGPEDWSRQLGFADVGAFYRALAGEYLYSTHCDSAIPDNDDYTN